MASQLPTVPRLVFTVVEPISLIGGCVPALFLTDWFIAEQFSDPAAAAAAVPAANANANARLVAQQLGNAYGLLFMVGVAILYTTTELRVVRNYLVALLLADVGHVGLTMAAIGPEQFAAVRAWNAMTWGNTFLALTRISYLLGLFGRDKPALVAESRKAR